MIDWASSPCRTIWSLVFPECLLALNSQTESQFRISISSNRTKASEIFNRMTYSRRHIILCLCPTSAEMPIDDYAHSGSTVMGYLFLGIRTRVGCRLPSSSKGFHLHFTKGTLISYNFLNFDYLILRSPCLLVSAYEMVDKDADLQLGQMQSWTHSRPVTKPQKAVWFQWHLQ